MRRARWALCSMLSLGIAALLACEKKRDLPGATTVIDPETGEDRECPTWKGEIAGLLTERCSSCHSGATPAGSYDTGSYLGVLGAGTDAQPNAIAGDRGSRIVEILDPDRADEVHRAFSDVAPLIAGWVGECRLAYVESFVHDPGIMNPRDPEFHGRVIEDLGSDLRVCQNCHGEDFSGGSANATCNTCHAGGPTTCVTCHRSSPESGLHPVHVLGGLLQDPVGCASCHVVPASWDAPHHIVLPNGELDAPPAEINFGAAATLGGARPEWRPESATCTGVACHGALHPERGGTDPEPRWDPAALPATCDRCHGMPPPDHASARCGACHPGVETRGVPDQIEPALHIDGVLQIGKGKPGCEACHGSGMLGAPPPDLFGSTTSTAIGVGMHQSHVNAPHRLSAPIACSDCHLVPTGVRAPGHIDTELPAEVFPPEIAATSLAAKDGAMPRWSGSEPGGRRAPEEPEGSGAMTAPRAEATCSNVYCHGSGQKLLRDQSPSIDRTPSWVSPDATVFCGSCHGLPPQDGLHPPATIMDCARCHPSSVEPTGQIIINTAPGGAVMSEHIDGNVDF